MSTAFRGYNTQRTNKPPVALISALKEYSHVGELIILHGNSSYDPDNTAATLTYKWELSKKPKGSSSKINHLSEDRASISFVPDVLGIYEVSLVVNDSILDSEKVSLVTVARQADIPHGQAYKPDMRWMWGFLRNWNNAIEDRDRVATIWSAVTQLASEALIRLYEINLSKSIRTVPELLQHRWTYMPLRVDVEDGSLINFDTPDSGKYGGTSDESASANAVQLEKFVPCTPDRVIIIDGFPRSTSSKATVRTYTDFTGAQKTGCRIGVNETLPTQISDAYWWLSTGAVITDNEVINEQRCVAGDLLAVTMESGNKSTEVFWRITGVTSDGYIGFELTPEELTDTYSYYNTDGTFKQAVTQQLEDAFYVLDLDPGQFTYRELAVRMLELLFGGKKDRFESDFGVTLTPYYVVRLSRYSLPKNTISVPSIQANLENPVFVLRQNEDYVVVDDDIGEYIKLGDNVVLDETDLPKALWAEVSFVDNSDTVENNFGILVGGERDNLPDKITVWSKYRSAVQGLMYAFANGPTPANIRLGVQIVLGLPFTEHRGIVRVINPNYSDDAGLIIMEDVVDGETTGLYRLYNYPKAADLEQHPTKDRHIQVGDTLPPDDSNREFMPLCTGVSVHDWVNDPDWWTNIYDSKVPLPKYHEAFFEFGWVPDQDQPWPDAAMSPFQEAQKIHTFQVLLDPEVFDIEDMPFAHQFVQGLQKTWRMHQEKKGIRPHYTSSLLVAQLNVEDQLEILDKILFTLTGVMTDDATGYEASMRMDEYNNSSNRMLYHDAPMRASRTTKQIEGRFVSPHATPGLVRLDIDKYSGNFQIGETVFSQLVPYMEAEIVDISTSPAQPGSPVNEVLYVRYLPDTGPGPKRFFPYDRLEGTASGALAAILNETPALFESDYEFAESDTDYHVVRFRDILFVESGPYKGRYGVFRIDPAETQRLIIYQLRTDDPTHHPPVPYGPSDPNGNSSFRPLTDQEITDWQGDSNTYQAQVERPFHNPLHSAELYMQDPAKSMFLPPTVGSPGEFDTELAKHMHRDNIRSGHMLRVLDPAAGAAHNKLFEIIRGTVGDVPDPITAFDLGMWDEGAALPGLRLYGGPIANGWYGFEAYDPRLPYQKYLVGDTLPAQGAIADNFEVIFPALAESHDDFYNGMYMRVIGGAGQWDPSSPNGGWLVIDYNGATKTATLQRNHRGVFDNTSVIEINSFKPKDNARPISLIRGLYPASLVELSLMAAVKASDDAGTCTVSLTALGTNVVAANPANMKPGTQFNVNNPAWTLPTDPSWPFETGQVQTGDFLLLTPTADLPEHRILSSRLHEISSVIDGQTLDLVNAPGYTASGMLFTIIRAVPTTWRTASPNHVPGAPILYTPVSEWTMW